MQNMTLVKSGPPGPLLTKKSRPRGAVSEQPTIPGPNFFVTGTPSSFIATKNVPGGLLLVAKIGSPDLWSRASERANWAVDR